MPLTIKSSAIGVKKGQGYDPISAFFLGDVRNDVYNWLSENSVQLGFKNFATPEEYGAVGDGVADDTLAWQQAVDSGKDVRAEGKKYKCGTINVKKNLHIDCNGADFLCTANTLFDMQGTITETLDGQPDYTFNQIDYQITGEHNDYTGFAMLKGTNRFDQSRLYYYGGFVCTFKDGLLEGSYPVDVTNGTDNTTILLIEPITATLENLGSVTHTASGTNISIKITYGYGCVVDGVSDAEFASYSLIWLDSCLGCICQNIKLTGAYGATGTNSYSVAFINSSYCVLRDSHLYNRYWHCCTTGGNYLCYRNLLDNCVLLNGSGYAYDDHENGVGTIIRCCTIAGLVLGPQSIVENTIIQSMQIVNGRCKVYIQSPTDKRLAGCYLSNVQFSPDADSSECGIVLDTFPQTRDEVHTYYYDDIVVKDVWCNSKDHECKITLNPAASYKHFYIGKIRLDNDMPVDLTNASGQYVDASNMDVKRTVYEAVN